MDLPGAKAPSGTLYRTRDQARADVFDYVEWFYNPRRRHSMLGQLNPDQFEKAWNCSGYLRYISLRRKPHCLALELRHESPSFHLTPPISFSRLSKVSGRTGEAQSTHSWLKSSATVRHLMRLLLTKLSLTKSMLHTSLTLCAICSGTRSLTSRLAFLHFLTARSAALYSRPALHPSYTCSDLVFRFSCRTCVGVTSLPIRGTMTTGQITNS